MANSAVTLSASGPATLSATSVNTTASGEFSVNLTGTLAGTVTITTAVTSAGSATVLTLTPDTLQNFFTGLAVNNVVFTLKDSGLLVQNASLPSLTP